MLENILGPSFSLSIVGVFERDNSGELKTESESLSATILRKTEVGVKAKFLFALPDDVIKWG